MADVLIAHNSFSNAGVKAVSFDGAVTTRTVIHSNVLPNGQYGVHGTNAGVGISTLTLYAPDGIFSYNGMIGSSDCRVYPATNFCPATIPSPLPIGYDARTVGADVAKVNAATSGVIVAP
jgi:hypothetical protein